MDANVTYGEKAWRQLHKNAASTYLPSLKGSKPDKPDLQDHAGEVRTNSYATYSCGIHHMDEQRQDDRLESICSSSVPIRDLALKTYREWWTIETGSKRGLGRSMLAVWHDDDDQCSNPAER